MKKLTEAVSKMNRTLWNLAGILLILISLAVVYDVISRYFFNHSSEWVGEYSGYMLVCIAFLAAPHTLFVGGMTRIDLLINKVSQRGKRILMLLGYLVMLGYLGVLLSESGKLAFASLARGWKSATSIRTPLWIPQLAIPAGALLLILTTVVLLLQTIITPLEADKPRVKLTDEELAKQILAEAIEGADCEGTFTDAPDSDNDPEDSSKNKGGK